MEFLIRFEISIPPELSDDDLAALMAEEAKISATLWTSGRLKRLWRVPGGRRSSVGLYDFRDADELHDTFSSFPLFPYMRVASVEPLATHPAERARPGATAPSP